MEKMHRYAVYYAPRSGAFADHAACWLGCNGLTGADMPPPEVLGPPDVPGLPESSASLTKDPRRYGFHGTIRAPFRPAEGISVQEIGAQVASLAAGLQPVMCDGLQIENLHGFVALTPGGGHAALQDLAASVVKATNPLRAPLSESEIARRHPERLTPRQRDLLRDWGYPFVMEEFRFHLTLTDRLPQDQLPTVIAALWAYFDPVLPRPFLIEDLCLFGEDAKGRFHMLHRYALTG
jgi:hypothetical protein